MPVAPRARYITFRRRSETFPTAPTLRGARHGAQHRAAAPAAVVAHATAPPLGAAARSRRGSGRRDRVWCRSGRSSAVGRGRVTTGVSSSPPVSVREALDRHPDAEGELPERDRQASSAAVAETWSSGRTGWRCWTRGQERAADEAERRDDAGHQPGPVHHRAEAQGVEGGHEPGAEQEGPVVQGDQRVRRVVRPVCVACRRRPGGG